MRLNDLTIKSLKPPSKGVIYYTDDILTGFGVRVSEGGTKSFVLTHGKLRKRETIGRVGILGLSEARGEAKRRLAEYTLGKTVVASVSWSDGVDLFLTETARRLKTRTQGDYRRLLTKHFRFGSLKLTELTAADIHRRIEKLSSTPVEQHHAFVVLRTFMKWAHRKHYIDVNPMERMQSGWRYRPRERILTDDELRRVWDAAGDDTFGTIVKLLILTGQRTGEVSKLSRSMIGKETITLPATHTKNGREHTFPIAATTRKLLRHIPFETLPNFARYKGYLDEASSVSGWTLHDLRRTFASGLASLGVALPVVEKLLNHVSGSFAGIVGVYQRYDYAKEMREAVELWDRHVQALLA